MSAAAIQPYYQADSITIFHARWEDVHAAGLLPVDEIALVHADPPYGVNERTDRRSKGRGIGSSGSNAIAFARDFPPVTFDDRPYDPAPLLALDRPTVMWGANHYAPRVPETPSWIVWDKRENVLPDDNADAELAWSNLGGPVRVCRHLWKGAIKASEKQDARIHPTQKPVALCHFVYQRAKLKPGDLVFVPYLGSGPDIAAARAAGLRLIGCDVESWCCRTAVSARLHAMPHAPPAAEIGPLFAPPENAR